MDERRRAILEGIIDAADSTPEQKLRAIEVLNEAEPVHERRDLSHLSDQELDHFLDEELAGDLPALLGTSWTEHRRTAWPPPGATCRASRKPWPPK